ncbi:MAG: glycosyltransferase family 2 protein [Eubacterium sp.]|nr:glycosyltransferase family 2 protein [Eubacterium sp.]
MNITIGIIALNEMKYLPALLEDVRKQTYPHEKLELVLADSGSTDGTAEYMKDFQQKYIDEFFDIKVCENTGGFQSTGWNTVICNFSTDALIRVDAHSHIPPEFVQKNVENFQRGEMVSGGMRPTLSESEGGFADTLLLAEESMFGSSISSSRRKAERAYVKSFFHGAYRREVFKNVGGFREDLGRTEDNEFHYRIRQHGYRLCMSPDIVSYQYIRPTFGKMCRQKFGNGYWVGLTLGVCPGCLSLYHFVPAAFVAGIVFTSLLAMLHFPWLAIAMWSLYGLLAIGMTVLAIAGDKMKASHLLLPFLFLILHLAYGIGTWKGLFEMPFFRKKHRECESINRVKECLCHERTTL